MYDNKKSFKIIALVFSIIGILFIGVGLIVLLSMNQSDPDIDIVLMVFGFIGAVFLICGIIFTIIRLRPSKLEKLKLSGASYPAEILSVKSNPYFNSGSGYVGLATIECTFKDKYGKSYIVSGRNYMPNLIDNNLENTKVLVWMDERNPEKYAIEVLDTVDKSKYDFDLRKRHFM